MTGLTTIIRDKLASAAARGLVALEQSTDEVRGSLEHFRKHGGRAPVFSAMARKKKKLVRREENYLYSTRRFPSNTANNTIGSGAITAGDYDYFANGIGDVGSAMGYFSLSTLGYHHTNMDKGGKIPTGRGFALYELAVSFNSNASAADIAQMMDASELRYEKQGGQLTVHHGPVRFWPGGIGLAGFGSAATTVAATTVDRFGASNGAPHLSAVRRFKKPRLLNANDSFRYVMAMLATQAKSNATIALSDFVEMTVWLFGFHYDRVPE